MTWQGPGGNAGPGGPGEPDDDATRSDWDLAQLDARVGGDPGAGRDPSPPAAPGAGAPPPPASGDLPGPSAAPPAGPPPPPAPGGPGPGATPPALPGYGAPVAGPGYAPGMAWEPPVTYGGPAGPGGGLEFAGVGARFVAWLLDLLLLGLVGGVISWMLMLVFVGTSDWTAVFMNAGSGTLALDQGFFGRVFVVSLVATLLSTAINLAYFVLLWSSGARATLGMRLLGLQVGNAADGRTLDRGQALKRWIAMGEWAAILTVIPAVGGLASLAQLVWYLVLLFTTANSPRRQGLHDQYAGTAVVQPAGKSNSGLIIGCITLFLIVFVVLPLVAIVALIFLGGQVSTILSTVGDSI